MRFSVYQTSQRFAAAMAGLLLATALCGLAGCSRDDASASGNPERGSGDSAIRGVPAEIAGPSSARADDAAGVNHPPAAGEIARVPAIGGREPIDPVLLEDVEYEPGHDALLEALEDNGGDLKDALAEISVRIEHSSRGDVILLNLSGPHVTDAALQKIATLENLLVLDVWDAPITDEGLAHLSELTQLRALGLRGTRVTDEGLKHLSGLKSLKELNLTLTAVTDEGMRHLAGLKSLDALGLDDTTVTGAGVNELQTALPLCRIAW